MRIIRSIVLPSVLGQTPQPLLVFDGVCVLCSRAVRFVLQREQDTAIRFCPAQSPLGQQIFAALNLPLEAFETFIVLDDGKAYMKSAAVLHLARHLRQPWRSLAALAILPRGLLDWLYDRVARNRYRVFGRYDVCIVPDAALKERFVETAAAPEAPPEAR